MFPGLARQHHRSAVVDSETAAKGQLQVVAPQVAEEEADGQDEKGQGEGAAHVCDKTHSHDQSQSSISLHQSEEWRQSGR